MMTRGRKKQKVTTPSKKKPPRLSPFTRAVRIVAALERVGWYCGVTREERRESYAAVIKALDSARPLTALEKVWGKGACGDDRRQRRTAISDWRTAVALSNKA